MDIREAKSRLTIPALWARLDLPGSPKASCKSPFREDKRASFSVSKDGQFFHDFTTGEGGDAVDFLQIATGLSSEAAFKRFIEMAGGTIHEPNPLPKRAAPEPAPRQKPIFPGFESGTDSELHRLAELRKVSFAACFIARAVGLLRFATLREHRAWIITDNERLNAQARRLDGEPWEHIGGKKAWTLPGAWASHPIGRKLAEPYPIVLIVEGGPDLLAALDFQNRGDGLLCSCCPVAMLGASLHIPDDALPTFAGKRVRIYGHTDEAGRGAAKRWAAQLEAVGAEVDCADFRGLRKADGSSIEDLNDATQIHPEDAHELKGLFPE